MRQSYLQRFVWTGVVPRHVAREVVPVTVDEDGPKTITQLREASRVVRDKLPPAVRPSAPKSSAGLAQWQQHHELLAELYEVHLRDECEREGDAAE